MAEANINQALDDLATTIFDRFKSAPDAATITLTLAPEDVGRRTLMFWRMGDGERLQEVIRRELRTRRAVKDVIVCFPGGEQPMRINLRRK